MQINQNLFQEIAQSQSKILLVTKYWNKTQTEKLIEEAQEKFPQIFIGVGENRVESLVEKKIPQNLVHFIGRIQSKRIPQILEYSSVIHSLDSLKHAEKIQKYLEGSTKKNLQAFLQISLDPQKPSGISLEKLEYFLEEIKNFDRIEVVGISGMGRGAFTQEEKIQEFKTLKKAQKILQNFYTNKSPLFKGDLGGFSLKKSEDINELVTPLPWGEVGRGVEGEKYPLISAGTSRDYPIALQQKIDIVRIGQKGAITVK